MPTRPKQKIARAKSIRATSQSGWSRFESWLIASNRPSSQCPISRTISASVSFSALSRRLLHPPIEIIAVADFDLKTTNLMAESSQTQQSESRRPSGPLTMNEISKFFYLPIADAASNLGVGTSALKRMCRDNGLLRWPYRKIQSGKTIEEINKELAASISPATVDTNLDNQLEDGLASSDAALKMQRGALMSDNLLQQQGSRFLQSGRQNVSPSGLAKTIPTYLDEFKQGFPSNGLSSVSNRWWGSASPEHSEKTSEKEQTNTGAEEQLSHKLSDEMETAPEKIEEDGKNDVAGLQGAALLSSVRKRVAEDGRKAVKLGVARGYGPYSLGKKERTILAQVKKTTVETEAVERHESDMQLRLSSYLNG
ncbi:hypothetical protein ACLOJK_010942 [Asimina triloba]